MYHHFFVLGLLAICVTIELAYWLSAVLFFLGFSYVFLLEQARYLNHFYLVVLLSFLLIFLSAYQRFSVDAWLFSALKKGRIPRWGIFTLQLQLGIVYYFGGIAKLNDDWLTEVSCTDWRHQAWVVLLEDTGSNSLGARD